MDKIFGIKATQPHTISAWLNLLHPDDKKLMNDYFQNEVLGRGIPFDKEYRIIRPYDHAIRWVHGLGRLIFNSKKQPVSMIGTIQDITTEITAREILRKSEKKFSDLFKFSPYVLTITRLKDGKFLNVNDAFVTLSGITRKEALAGTSIGFGVWSVKKNRQKIMREIQSKGFVNNREFPSKSKKSGVLTGLYSAKLIMVNGESCILSSVADITKLKQTESAVLELKNRDEAMLASIGDAVFACDLNGNILLFNKMAEQMTGILSEDAVGKHYKQVLSFIRETDGKPIRDFVAQSIRSNAVTKMTRNTLLIRKDGVKIPVADSAAPIRNISGKAVGCVVVFHDVTKDRQIDKAKTEFVSLASHQLRTPLTAINWYCEMLLNDEKNKLNSVQEVYAKETYKASKRMVALMNALLNVSRLETGTFAVEPKLINIIHIAKNCINDLESRIIKKKIILEEKYGTDKSEIYSDPKLTGIVFQNLLTNAIKYTKSGGKVSLEIKRVDNSILITVSDTGVGIPKNQQDKIFTKLFRADNAKKMDPDGTGLGLYMVKGIMEACGGKVWFSSKEGEGSVFNVTLPIGGMKKKSGTSQLI